MFLFSWLRKMTTPTQPIRRNSCHQFRPRLDILEDRTVPAVLSVTTALDVVDPNDGVLSLREAIQQADPVTPGGDTIVFDSGLNGQTITLNGSELLLDKNLNIQGPGADQLAISGNFRGVGSYSRVFEAAAGVQVSLSGLTVRDGYAIGSATSAEAGGGILNLGKLAVRGCSFWGNDANNTGGAIANGNGFYSATLTLNDCTFSENFSAGNGGAVTNANGTASISLSTFSMNEAYSAGGGIFNNNAGTLIVTNCNFSANDCWHGSGGAIFAYNSLTVGACSFSGNVAASPFSNDPVPSSNGGAIYTYGTASISGSSFSGNVANFDGGAIYDLGTLTVGSCTLSGNTASNGSGGGILNRGNGTISSTTLSGNNAQVNGGGLCTTFGTLTLSGCTLSDNFASQGGAIYSAPNTWGGGSLMVSGCTISGNTADVGGGIYNANISKATLTIKDSTITSNTAISKGGGIYNDGTISIQNSKVSSNSAGLNGGGIFNDSAGTLTLYSSTTVTGNLAQDGADIYNVGRITKKKS